MEPVPFLLGVFVLMAICIAAGYLFGRMDRAVKSIAVREPDAPADPDPDPAPGRVPLTPEQTADILALKSLHDDQVKAAHTALWTAIYKAVPSISPDDAFTLKHYWDHLGNEYVRLYRRIG